MAEAGRGTVDGWVAKANVVGHATTGTPTAAVFVVVEVAKDVVEVVKDVVVEVEVPQLAANMVITRAPTAKTSLWRTPTS